ncbi:MAG TPA: hypothetical protein VHM24_07990 [Gemmatimonadaceae bacterium]|nr:hypothetical protein [Gemmatimonadaceae bacterium]
MGQFLPADHSRGDANTVGGYAAVHSRPAAFEGKDGTSYSVEIMSDATGDAERPWAAYLLFVSWGPGDPVASGHVETDYLEYAATDAEARAKVGAMQLNDALAELDRAIAARASDSRPWWESMKDEDNA